MDALYVVEMHVRVDMSLTNKTLSGGQTGIQAAARMFVKRPLPGLGIMEATAEIGREG